MGILTPLPSPNAKKAGSVSGLGLKRCNDLIYRVVTSLYRRIGNEKATVCFQSVAPKYRISNNLLQDMKNFQNGQIYFVEDRNDKHVSVEILRTRVYILLKFDLGNNTLRSCFTDNRI